MENKLFSISIILLMISATMLPILAYWLCKDKPRKWVERLVVVIVFIAALSGIIATIGLIAENLG